MCGIVGFLKANTKLGEGAEEIIRAMANAIVHRGPDDEGQWYDNHTGIALGHRRLSIVELSRAGHQPMISSSGRYVIVFNGEIYNHQCLRAEIQASGYVWRGHSDTESILAAIEAWGIHEAIKKCVGMFAFALWDKQNAVLTLARDRLGEKPLYYGWQGSGNDRVFIFGSELSALVAHPTFCRRLDRQALALFIRYGYVPSPHSIYQNIKKLPAGCLLVVSANQQAPSIEPYWSLTKIALASRHDTVKISSQHAVAQLKKLLIQSVQQQIVADVPLGAFLSGGIDSSTIVALMQAQSTKPIQTFTIGFDDADHNEAIYAKAIAHHLGTQHTELYVTHAETIAVIPKLPILYSEPFADSSQIPTYLVSQLAHARVKVALSGDGGDELFCGYNRYAIASQLWHKLSFLPKTCRAAIASFLLAVSPAAWDSALKYICFLLPRRWQQVNFGQKLHKGAKALVCDHYEELYLGFVSHWDEPSKIVIGLEEAVLPSCTALEKMEGLNNVEQMMLWDTLCYLPNDILAKVDRAAMGVSLETRVPFLDHRIVEYAWSLPHAFKLREGQSKWVLRQILYDYVPKSLVERPKAGFSIPLGAWLRGPLRDWAEALLDGSRLRREGNFHPEPIRQKWDEHLAGRKDWQSQLWHVLMFQAWLEQQQNIKN